ncbi:response regulator [Galbitalea sp. SE-J8]|uniref:response regulator n=1 Tax=Galbitalea sp. SE-J8 TaxID=3054952 RepID=UPI00259D2B04|nr:response regulator [Galbitalea sp. SE-J8]MDM4763536.1 response regulator [Galbitalea sp. SE-J8]
MADHERAPVRVVVADDDADIRMLVAIAVRRAGVELVGEAADGESALAAIREHRPDFAILDVSMPGRTGLDVVRDVRADPALGGIRLMLLSAGVTDAAIDAGIAAGADDYLTKPFSPKELAARISAALDAWAAGADAP